MRLAAGTLPLAAALLASAVAPAVGARADEVVVRRRPPYPGVTITEAKDGAIVFRLPSGGLSQPLWEVERIQIARKDAFNRAERLLADPNTAVEAMRAYEEAASSMSAGWQARLLLYRRLAAAERAGLIEAAVRDWLAAMDESPAQAVIDLRPKLAAKITGAPAAIAALEAKLKAAKDAARLLAIKGLLLGLYEREGPKEKAAALAAELGGPGSAPEQGISARDRLRGLQVRLEGGEAQGVLEEVEKQLKQFAEEDLPRALLLAGKARLRLAEGAADPADKKKQLVAGALSLMRVYAYYPRSADAAEAMYLAGQAHVLLPQPNEAAASAAFERVSQEYSSSPFAALAKTALEKVKK